MPKSLKYTKEYLEPIVKSAKTWTEIFVAIGIPYNGGNTRNIKSHISHHNINVDHLKKKEKPTKERMAEVVASVFSWAETIKMLELKDGGSSRSKVKIWAKLYGLETSHFKGQAWNAGLTRETDDRVNKFAKTKQKLNKEILIENYPGTSSTKMLRRAMIENGIDYICENGHEPVWMGKDITLHIDHINGTSNDNRIKNLRFLCPNCHQQTTTWGSRSS